MKKDLYNLLRTIFDDSRADGLCGNYLYDNFDDIIEDNSHYIEEFLKKYNLTNK